MDGLRSKAQSDQINIPLQQLQLSPRNARKTGGGNVHDLAASIAAHGLLQNLTVQQSANDGSLYEVVAGGRRLAAMHLLAQRGELPADLINGVPCRLIIDDGVALEASTAENTLREAMHPADQFEAFKGMIDIGRPIVDVAAHFGVTEAVVRQRLKLANVNPQLVQIYREGGMSLEQLQALALTDNHEVQRQAWFTKKNEWERHAQNLREFITRQEVHANSTLARFVGIDAYIAAGGAVRQDLFSSRNDAWLQDSALLDKLALDKLEALADQERADGWSWVETHISLDYSQRAEYVRVEFDPALSYATPQDEQRDTECQVRIEEIEDIDSDDIDQDHQNELSDELQRLEQERDEINLRMIETWPEPTKAQSGVLIYLDRDGIHIARGYLKPGQKLDKKSGAITGAPAANKPATKAKPATLSGAVLLNLSAHRSEVARYHVARDPQLALALLVDWYVSALKHDFSHSGLLNMSGTSVNTADKVAPDIHKALSDESTLPAAAFKKIPKADRLAWLVKQPQADLLQMIAYCVASRFSGITESTDGHRGVAALHAIIGFDMADHWTPACDNFLGRIPATLVTQAVSEAKGKDAAAALQGLKKDALIAEASKALAGTGWLPKPLRGATYALNKPKAPQSAPSKAPAKAAAAKSAAKAPAKQASTRPKKKPSKVATKKTKRK